MFEKVCVCGLRFVGKFWMREREREREMGKMDCG